MISLGAKLKQTRVDKGLTLEDVSKNTKIKTHFLEAIENGDYQNLPSVSYAQGFVKNYIDFLGLDEKEMMAIFRREFDSEKAYKVLPKGFETEEFSMTGFKIGRTAILIIVVLILFLGYIAFQYRYAFLNPPLTIFTPKNMTEVSSSQVKASGNTDPNATVYVNQDGVNLDSNGNFVKLVNVFPGKTTILVKVINKFSRQTQKEIDIDVK